MDVGTMSSGTTRRSGSGLGSGEPFTADSAQARLAILGFDSSVEPANLPDKGTWYRVRMGPFNKLDEINRIRQALAQNNIDASLVKIKEQP